MTGGSRFKEEIVRFRLLEGCAPFAAPQRDSAIDSAPVILLLFVCEVLLLRPPDALTFKVAKSHRFSVINSGRNNLSD